MSGDKKSNYLMIYMPEEMKTKLKKIAKKKGVSVSTLIKMTLVKEYGKEFW